MDRRGHVDVDDVELVAQARVAGEVAAGAPAGVERDRLHRPIEPGDVLVEVLDTGERGEIDLNGLDVRLAVPAKRRGRVVDARVLGRDQQVEPVFGELPGQFQPDAAGGAGDDRERSS